MCEFYNVSRQGYYDYINLKQAGNPDQELIDMIEECQNANKKRLGYRRVQKWLKREKGLVVNHKKVYRITSRNNLQSVIRRLKTLKYKPNGNLKHDYPISSWNVILREEEQAFTSREKIPEVNQR